ncbi:MAG: hypothetical protein JWN17_2029 [Frankiales bacterium]|nr:hypothetical protein [Frankiales bacterium]
MTATSTSPSTGLSTTVEMTARYDLAAPVPVGPGPFGTRMVFGFTGGRVEGERISADVVPGGADYLLVGPDGFGRIDVRGTLQTDDGAAVYVHYTGLISMNEAVGTALATGGGTEWTDQYFRVAPQFETGDERYAWLNQSLFVAEGRIVPGAIEYRICRVS